MPCSVRFYEPRPARRPRPAGAPRSATSPRTPPRRSRPRRATRPARPGSGPARPGTRAWAASSPPGAGPFGGRTAGRPASWPDRSRTCRWTMPREAPARRRMRRSSNAGLPSSKRAHHGPTSGTGSTGRKRKKRAVVTSPAARRVEHLEHRMAVVDEAERPAAAPRGPRGGRHAEPGSRPGSSCGHAVRSPDTTSRPPPRLDERRQRLAPPRPTAAACR